MPLGWGISMQKGFLTFLLLVLSQISLAGELQSLDFTQKGELSLLEITTDSDATIAKKFHITEDKQVIIDLVNTKASEKVIRAFDTSEFSGSVVFVNAYPKPNAVNDLRIAIQLRENVRSNLKQDGKKYVLEIENRFGVFSQQEVEKNATFEEKIAEGDTSVRIHVPKSDSVEDILENLTLSGRKKYIGKKISFSVKDVTTEDVLRMIADASGFNIILTEELKKLPPMSLNLTDVPWDQALDTILGLNKLVAKKNGIILMITTLEKATAEKKLEIEAKNLAQTEEPLVTKIFPISYASLEEISSIIKEYSTKERGKISQDSRTNSLIVKDTVDVIEKIKKIIETLDTQTPQVLIEAKVVEVKEQHRKEIGLTSGFNFGYDPMGAIDRTVTTPVGGSLAAGSAGFQAGPGFQFSSASLTGAGATAFGLNVSRFNRFFELNFALSLLESESKLKIISSPKVITQNKKKAEISAKDTTSFAVVTGIGDAQTRTFSTTDANLLLAVTPQITNEGSISLDMELTKEAFGPSPEVGAPPDKTTRNVKTNVLVDNGSTIVLGGVYNYQKQESISGIPFLKDLPLLGWLFRSPINPTVTKSELVIFLTPRIINQEEAGLSGAAASNP